MSQVTPDLDHRVYLEIIMNGAAQFLAQMGTEKARHAFSEDSSILDEPLHPFVKGVLARAHHLEDILKASGRKDPDPSVWRDAVDWPDALFRVAYLMVLEDLKEQAARMCREGETILNTPPAE